MKINLQSKKDQNQTPDKLSWLVNHGITQSILKTWRSTCPKKARYILDGYYKEGSSEPLAFGEILHSMLEIVFEQIKSGKINSESEIHYQNCINTAKEKKSKYLLGASPKILQIYEKTFGMAEAVFSQYFKYWENEYFGTRKRKWLSVEGKFRCFPQEISPVPILGRRDGVSEDADGIWIDETKTKSSWNEENLVVFLMRDIQTIMYGYSWFLETGKYPIGVRYNLVRRPALRQKDSESLVAFVNRIKEDVIEKPDTYFEKIEVPLPGNTIRNEWQELVSDLMNFVKWYLGDHDSKYTENCVTNYGACPFLKLETSGYDDRVLKRNVIHVELEN